MMKLNIVRILGGVASFLAIFSSICLLSIVLTTCLGKVGKNEWLFSITAKNDSLISVKQNSLDDIAQGNLSDDAIDLYFDMQSAYLLQYINFYGLTLEDRPEGYGVDWHWTLRFHNYWGRVEEATEDD